MLGAKWSLRLEPNNTAEHLESGEMFSFQVLENVN